MSPSASDDIFLFFKISDDLSLFTSAFLSIGTGQFLFANASAFLSIGFSVS